MTEIILAIVFWLILSVIFFSHEEENHLKGTTKERTQTNFNLIALVLNVREGGLKVILPKPRTPIQKEIAEEQAEINKLKRLKQDMERLDALKREREAYVEDDFNYCPGCGLKLNWDICEGFYE